MKEGKSGIVLLAAALILIAASRMGAAGRASAVAEEESGIRGYICLAGSSSMERFVSALAEGFMEKYPDVTVNVQYTGSGAGIAAVTAHSAEIGLSSRYLEEEEKAGGAEENIVGLDGIAICVDAANPVRELTGRQLADIYTGKITNWAEVGGENIPVVVIGREAGSGTRCAFEKCLDVEERCAYANELDSTGAVAARVLSAPGAVGYVSFDILNRMQGSIAGMKLDGIEPLTEHVESGSYPLYRPFVMVTQGEISEQNALVQLWFAYVYGEEGQQAAKLCGVVSAGEKRPDGCSAAVQERRTDME